ALAAALLWFVNPVQIQSVTYIVQRMNSMAAMFYVLSLWLYMRGRLTSSARAGRVWLAGAAGAGLCALGSKEIAATLPLLIFLCEWYFIQVLSRAWLKRALPLILALAGLFLFIVFFHLGADPLAAIQGTYRYREFSLAERLLTELRVVVFYLSLFFYPAPQRLNLDHHFALSGSLLEPVATLLAGFLIVFLAGAAILGARRGSPAAAKDERRQPDSARLILLFSFALAWFLLNLLIESTVIGLEIVFEHRLYLPSMFLALPLVATAHRLIEPAWLKTGALTLLLLAGSAWTVERNELWRDPIALWTDSAAKSPGKARTHNNLAVVLWEDGQLARAEFEAGEAIRLDPDDVNAFNCLGNIYKDQGRLAQAVRAYRNALRLEPASVDAYIGLANIAAAQGRLGEAADLLDKGLALEPRNLRVQVNLASVYAMRGMSTRAIAGFEAAVRLSPENPDIQYNLGLAYAETGRTGEALVALRTAIRLDPADREAARKISELERRLRR
ncbi:MAG: tetratricopeptide repeat protein, partial [Desulfurivibrionaceae bacterium]